MKHSKKFAFFQNFFQKNQEAEFFLKNFFNEKVAKDSTLFWLGQRFFVSLFSSEENPLQVMKKWEIFRIFSSSLYLPKKTGAKKIRRHYWF